MASLKERAQAAKAEAQTIYNTAVAENRAMTADEQTRFDGLIAEATTARAVLDQQASSAAALAAIAEGAPADVATAQRTGRLPSLGEAFVQSDIVAGLRHQYPNGIPSGATLGNIGSVHIADVMNTLLTNPGLTPPQHVLDVPEGVAVLDLLSVITTITDAPQSIKHFTASFTNAAAVVAEGGLKPESTLTWTPTPLTQETIAHHIPITNQALSHNAMLRQIVDRFLVAGVRSKMQAQVAAALAAWSGLGAQAWATDLRTTLRKAITKAQNAGQIIGTGPISIGISSADAETLDLEQLANLVLAPGQGPSQLAGIWRTPLVVSAALPAGFAYVGDLSQVILYTSGGVNVAVGLVNDQFIKNEQTIRAEAEGVTGVLGAGAIIKADLTA